jgi:hypothetical protein
MCEHQLQCLQRLAQPHVVSKQRAMRQLQQQFAEERQQT